jgi:phosphopantothenoylcysteine synthetase/decarboxylase
MTTRPTADHRFLVTAGNTREPIDRVRDWGNIFTGNTGYNIARALADALGPVDLFTSNAQHADEAGKLSLKHPITVKTYKSHADLLSLLDHAVPAGDYAGIFMAAAVSDYTPVAGYEILSRTPGKEPGTWVWTVRPAQAGKIKSHFDELALLGSRTEKIVDLFRTRWAFKGLLVKFKLEVGVSAEELITIGQKSRIASGADYLVANELNMVQGPNPGAYLLGDQLAEWVPRENLAQRLVRLVNGD